MKKISSLFSIVFIALLAIFLYPDQKTTVAIQPLGKISKKVIEKVRDGIIRLYDVEVVVLPAKELPASAYYKPRNRYRAEKLLDYLRKNTDSRFTKVLGLTSKDISTSKGKFFDWGIFGLGSVGGRPCVVSTFRLWRGKASWKKFIGRLIKVVNHELGHTFGLGHCPNKSCLMEDAKGTIRTVDRETGAFCDECRRRLKGIIR